MLHVMQMLETIVMKKHVSKARKFLWFFTNDLHKNGSEATAPLTRMRRACSATIHGQSVFHSGFMDYQWRQRLEYLSRSIQFILWRDSGSTRKPLWRRPQTYATRAWRDCVEQPNHTRTVLFYWRHRFSTIFLVLSQNIDKYVILVISFYVQA